MNQSPPRRGGKPAYRCAATSVAGFVQQLAVAYVGNGYYFYACGRIPPAKDPGKVDEKFIRRYDLDAISKFTRSRRKRAGLANHHYIRFENYFVLLASHGTSRFFEEEAGVLRDVRRVPIAFAGYSIGHRGGHVHVRIEREHFRDLRAYFLEIATRRDAAALAGEIRRHASFEPYAPVRSQCRGLLRAVNKARASAGLEPVPASCLRTRRRICRPFG